MANTLQTSEETDCKDAVDFDVMAAMSENRGIGLKNSLPWPKLEEDYKYYMTLVSHTKDPNKRNVNIYGRLTWGIAGHEEQSRQDVIFIVISRHPSESLLSDDRIHTICPSFDSALQYLRTSPLRKDIENVWVMGGQQVYESAIVHPWCRHIYLTHIYKDLESDTFFPNIDDKFVESKSLFDGTCSAQQEEHGIQYEFKVYQKRSPETSSKTA